MAQLILHALSESETTFSLQFQDNKINDKTVVGLDVFNEDKEESYLAGELILFDKSEAKQLVAYLQTLFDLK